ncbi:hypothetical protein F5X68DRAFT_230100 [Plectosphaerella plurivora]|uniref:Uncharacterized protein n=1 Tax=Plectosphaerella plurivora TaxID=936078 RepID=A0A9P8VG71_9PEZI|nr:hypothetical protein F5X68DRAFT_230100 [Plectosphaerella plurivora]
MKFSLAALGPLAALAGVCSANFDLYRSESHNLFGGVGQNWGVFPYDPSCAEVGRTRSYPVSGDVSGNKIGVRCSGDCDMGGRADGINQLEMHFSNNPLYHFTLYKERGHPYKMYGLDGRVYGECILFPGNAYNCPNAGALFGHRKFRCLTSISAGQINSAGW